MAADKATPEAVNFMAKHGRGLICVPMLGERLDELEDLDDGRRQHRPDGHRVHGHRRRPPRRHHRHLRLRPRRHHPHARGSRDAARDDLTRARPHLPAARDARRRAAPRRPHRSGRSIWRGWRAATRPASSARCWTRTAAWRACPQLNELAAAPRPQDDHDQGAHRVPHAQREAGAAASPRPSMPTEFGEFTAIAYEASVESRAPLALVMGDVSRRGAGARADALRVPDRATCSARAAATAGRSCEKALRDHRARGPGRRRLPAAGRAGDRARSTRCGPTSSRTRARTRSRPTTRSASSPIRATTASAPRSWSTSASRTCACSPTIPKKRVGLEGYGLHFVERVPLEVPPTDETTGTCRTKRDKLGHLLLASLTD